MKSQFIHPKKYIDFEPKHVDPDVKTRELQELATANVKFDKAQEAKKLAHKQKEMETKLY